MTKETKEFVNESSQERNMGKEKLKFLGMSNKMKVGNRILKSGVLYKEKYSSLPKDHTTNYVNIW